VSTIGDGGSESRRELAAVLGEQVEYYCAVAGEYEEHAIPGAWGGGLEAALDAFAPAGRVLELACGTGLWTAQLLRHADTVTAVDASAEMIAIASARVADERVRFIRADIFDWTPEDRYDVVFFGFWLSHVPLERFEYFWSLVGRCLAEDGRVFFVDDAYRTPDELVWGESSPMVRRLLNDGAAFRILKVPHTPAELEDRLNDLGWRVAVTPDWGPFFWGAGRLHAASI
jgi:demethylmenaquinone methyltransferase/2-methoxy-6-polyprenyl-1,4-benzoquinol methylase